VHRKQVEVTRESHQSLFDEQAEEDGVAHLPQALEHVGLQLGVLDDVLELMVEELQDTCRQRASNTPREIRQ